MREREHAQPFLWSCGIDNPSWIAIQCSTWKWNYCSTHFPFCYEGIHKLLSITFADKVMFRCQWILHKIKHFSVSWRSEGLNKALAKNSQCILQHNNKQKWTLVKVCNALYTPEAMDFHAIRDMYDFAKIAWPNTLFEKRSIVNTKHKWIYRCTLVVCQSIFMWWWPLLCVPFRGKSLERKSRTHFF